MTNQVLQSLEDSQSVASGGAYSYILSFTAPDGSNRILYSSEMCIRDSLYTDGYCRQYATYK